MHFNVRQKIEIIHTLQGSINIKSLVSTVDNAMQYGCFKSRTLFYEHTHLSVAKHENCDVDELMMMVTLSEMMCHAKPRATVKLFLAFKWPDTYTHT